MTAENPPKEMQSCRTAITRPSKKTTTQTKQREL